MEIVLNEIKYKVIKDYRDAFDKEIVTEKVTDYFNDFDYILGDWAYGKLRLKGFYKKDNKNVKEINDYERVNEYIKNNCAYDCRYFILEKQ